MNTRFLRLFNAVALFHENKLINIFDSFSFYMFNVFLFFCAKGPLYHISLFGLFCYLEGFAHTVLMCTGFVMVFISFGWYAFVTGMLYELSSLYIPFSSLWNFYFFIWFCFVSLVEYITGLLSMSIISKFKRTA